MTSTGVYTRGVAILAILLCSQVAVAWADGSEGSPLCSNDICKMVNQDSGSAPKHFIFVHGVGGGAWFWFEIVTLLERSGFTATAVDLTSHGINKAVADDVTTVAEYTNPLTVAIAAAPGKVILVGHSLGGGSIAYASELYSSKVWKAIYVSAVTPSYGQSMFGAFPAGTLPNLISQNYLQLNYRKGPASPSSITTNNLDKFYLTETPKKYINLAEVVVTDTPFVMGTVVLPLTPAKFGTVDRYYIRTGEDKAVSPADQDAMVAANPPKKVFCMPRGDHGVFFSAPMELFKLLTCIGAL